MATTKTQFVFDDAGRCFREDITRREMTITRDMINSMQSLAVIRAPKLVIHPKWGETGLCIDANEACWWTVRLKTLTLRCPWKVRDGGVLVPQLNNEGADPMLTREWTPPKDMRLVFLMQTRIHSSDYVKKEGYAWLFAFNTLDKNAYRLPIGNLFDDCHLCLGQEEFSGASHMEVLGTTLEQFVLSSWNSDLWRGEKVAKTQSLFQFKAKNESFEQLPLKENWTGLCYKVSVAITDKVVV